MWYWHVRVKHRVARGCAIMFAVLSCIIVIGEITIFSDIKIVEFKDFAKIIGTGFFETQVKFVFSRNINFIILKIF